MPKRTPRKQVLRKQAPISVELVPGVMESDLLELLASLNQGAVDGAAHLITVREYAERRSQNLKRTVTLDQARKDIKALMSIGKARFGGTKPQVNMSGRVNQSPAYELTL